MPIPSRGFYSRETTFDKKKNTPRVIYLCFLSKCYDTKKAGTSRLLGELVNVDDVALSNSLCGIFRKFTCIVVYCICALRFDADI